MKHLLFVSILLIGASCESNKESQKTDVDKTEPAMPAQTTREPATPPAPAAGELSDPEVAMIASTAHEAEVEAAELAAKKTKNADVQAFAQKMITEHGAALAKAEATVGKAGITPVASDASRELTTQAEQTMKRLEGLDGAEFDRAYIADQVKMHDQVLQTIDGKLMPAAENPELKTLLTEVRPVIAAHLEEARALEQKLQTAK